MTSTESTPARTRGKHRAPRPRWVKVLAAVLGLCLVGGVAYAAVMSRAGVQGQIGRGQFVLGYTGTPTVTNDAGTVLHGTVNDTSLTADKRAVLLPQVLDVYPGEHITVNATPATLSGSGRSGFISGLYTNAPVPAGWRVELVQGCGATVTTTGTPVKVRITPTSDTGPGLDATGLELGIVATAIPNGQTAPTGVTCPALGS